MDNSDERLLWLEVCSLKLLLLCHIITNHKVRVSSSLKRGHSEVFKRMLQKDDSRYSTILYYSTSIQYIP